MPILAEEPCLFPDDLFQEPTDGDQPDGPASERVWWVIYTKSRQEKSLARDLRGYRIPFYLPLVPRDHLIRGRRVHAHIPVFPGYVFLFGSPDERVDALTTNRISRILPVPMPMQDQLLAGSAATCQLDCHWCTSDGRTASEPGTEGADSQRPDGRNRGDDRSTARGRSPADRGQFPATGRVGRDQRLYGRSHLGQRS